ncbi:hypothetical protein DFH06DRAFT_55263 [Mycena polygramma]|nr:hypothetical protein DFH06DRAFT_55263 [Mycena polygramma]
MRWRDPWRVCCFLIMSKSLIFFCRFSAWSVACLRSTARLALCLVIKLKQRSRCAGGIPRGGSCTLPFLARAQLRN